MVLVTYIWVLEGHCYIGDMAKSVRQGAWIQAERKVIYSSGGSLDVFWISMLAAVKRMRYSQSSVPGKCGIRDQ